MSRYAVFYLLNSDAKKYQQNLVKTVGPKFGENYVLESRLPAHITLKTPFQTERIRDVEKTLKFLVEGYKPAKIKINGFGEFNKKVIFLNLEFNQEAYKMQKELIGSLKKIGVVITPHDSNFKPHSTISYSNTGENFEKIWSHLNSLEKPEISTLFDNMAIMKKEKYWKIHKKFKLNMG